MVSLPETGGTRRPWEDLKAKIVQKNLGPNWKDPLSVGTWAQSQGLKPIAGIGRRTVRKNRSGKKSDHIIRNPDFFFYVPPFSEGWLVLQKTAQVQALWKTVSR